MRCLSDRLRKSADECEYTVRSKLLAEAAETTDALFAALRDMAEWWAYAMAKPPGAEPDADDRKKVERLAAAAISALHKADPDYVHRLPSAAH